jgi:hypothetical protein
MTIPFRPVASSASGSTGGEKGDLARRARRSCHFRQHAPVRRTRRGRRRQPARRVLTGT